MLKINAFYRPSCGKQGIKAVFITLIEKGEGFVFRQKFPNIYTFALYTKEL